MTCFSWTVFSVFSSRSLCWWSVLCYCVLSWLQGCQCGDIAPLPLPSSTATSTSTATSPSLQRFFHPNRDFSCQKSDPLLYSSVCTTQDCQQLKRTILYERKKSNWNHYYSPVLKFLTSKFSPEDRNKAGNLKFVEVGTGWGGFANALLNTFGCTYVVAIDPAPVAYDDKDLTSSIYGKMAKKMFPENPQLFSALYIEAMYAATARNHPNYDIFHGISVDVAPAFENKTFDFIFIDGLHTYDGVMDDLRVWIPKMKGGAFVMFNDYGSIFPGVVQAAKEYAASISVTLHCCIGGSNAWFQLP